MKLFVSVNGVKKVADFFLIFLIASMFVLKVSGEFLTFYSPGIGLTRGSEDAGKFLKENHVSGPIFNDYDFGSYLINNLYPQEKVFMDNRPEAYTEDYFKNIYLPVFANDSTWHVMENNYHFNMIALYQYNYGPNVREFMYRRVADSTWALVYADRFAVILLKNNEVNKTLIEKYHLTVNNVEQRVNYLLKSDDYDDVVAAADVFNITGKQDRGMETFFRVVCKWPGKGKIWMVMAQWELANHENPKSPLLAVTYLQRAIREGWATSESYAFLGLAYRRIGFNDQAEEALKKSLQINPDRFDAREALNEMENEKKNVSH